MGAVRVLGVAVVLAAGFVARPVRAAVLAESISVSGDSIARGYDANTSACNYGDNVSRNWATGDTHGGSFCAAGGEGTFSHAERLECAKGGNVTIFNDAASGADMLSDFYNQAVNIKLNLSSSLAPRYVPVFMGHNDICTNTETRTGNACGGDDDPNNYCRTAPAAFEREFRRGMDQLIQIPSVRIGVSAVVRVSELCNFTGKSGCGITLGLPCSSVWGLVDICASLTKDCSNQRRIDAYLTALAYNQILEVVTAEYAAISTGGMSLTGAVKAPDVAIRYSEGAFFFKFASADVSCCDCFHPSDLGQSKMAQFGWDGLQCSGTTPCCGTSGDPLTDAMCSLVDTATFYPSGFWPGGMPCGNGILDPMEQCDDGNALDGDCCSSSCTFDPGGTPCASDGNVCTDDVCNPTGGCTHPANAAPCGDGFFCTVNDTCSGGSCAGTARDCSSAGNQCNVGVCDEAQDQCVAQPVSNGTGCIDGDACTQTDTCQNGTCTGANPVVCTAQDQCHDAGTCNPLTGVCSNPAKANGTACADGDACTQTDTCQGGTCTGANPVVCTAQDQCHDAGTCNPLTGGCSNPAKANGTACTDGDACTQTDTCQAGTCTGTNPVVCTAQNQCHDAGTCNPGTGVCSNPAKPDGSACSDGNACTAADQCVAGVCQGGAPPCGDGIVQASCGEQCDDGAANGTNQCCSATCQRVDGDGDGLCNRDDPCTGLAGLIKQRITITRLDTPPGDDRLSIKGDGILPFPFAPALNPIANGARLLVERTGGTLVDVTLPGLAWTGTVGWRVNAAGNTFTWTDKTTTPPGGITRFKVKQVAATPGLVQVRAKGLGSYSVTVGDLPLRFTAVLDPPTAETGQCGEATFPGPLPPSCVLVAAKLTCK